MSLITRGLGTPLLVTAGLGASGFVIVETGKIVSISSNQSTIFNFENDVSDVSLSIGAQTEIPISTNEPTTIELLAVNSTTTINVTPGI